MSSASYESNKIVPITKNSDDTDDDKIKHIYFMLECEKQQSYIKVDGAFVPKPERVKIGSSFTPKDRKSGLQTGNPDSLKVLFYFEGTAKEERALQKRFMRFHHRGEWYILSKEILEYIEQKKMELNLENRSFYTSINNTRVYWDADKDYRIVTVITALTLELEKRLEYNPIILAKESKGKLSLLVDTNSDQRLKAFIIEASDYFIDEFAQDIWETTIQFNNCNILDFDKYNLTFSSTYAPQNFLPDDAVYAQ
jgi:hypothetical protein